MEYKPALQMLETVGLARSGKPPYKFPGMLVDTRNWVAGQLVHLIEIEKNRAVAIGFCLIKTFIQFAQ